MNAPFNTADGSARVGFQAQYAYVDQLTVWADASPKTRYETGVRNLEHGNPERARELIWDAMTHGYVSSEILFHWLVAMLDGRTVPQFSRTETDQLRDSRTWFIETEGGAWADGVRLLYELLDSVLRLGGPATAVSVLRKQADDLGPQQRAMVSRLELFLRGPRRDEMWRDELARARSLQCVDDRLDRAWKFFHPDPFKVTLLPAPPAQAAPDTGRWWMWAGGAAAVLAAGGVALLMLDHGVALGLLGYVIALVGGLAAAKADLEPQLQAKSGRESDPFRKAGWRAVLPGDLLGKQVDGLFWRYFTRREPDPVQRLNWWNATAAAREFYKSEIVGICRANGISLDRVAWLIRYETGQMYPFRDGGFQPPSPPAPPLRYAIVVIRGVGLAALAVGLVLAVVAAPTYFLGLVAVLGTGIWAWRCWLRVRLGSQDSHTDLQEVRRRQAGIDAAYEHWKDRLKDRPTDAEVAEWLRRDRIVLLGQALDYFDLPRSQLAAYGFLEKPAPGAQRAQVDGGLPRYQRYQVWMFLLAEDGVRQVRFHLDFLTGIHSQREQISYGYDHIAAAHVMRESNGGQKFTLRLTAGEPIEVRLRKADLALDPGAGPGQISAVAAETDDAKDEGTVTDAASVANTLHILEGVAAEGRRWLREHDWAAAWLESQASGAALVNS